MKINSLFEHGVSLLEKIESLGYEAYIVGGASRDFMSGKAISDIDIATNCPVDILESKFKTYDIGKSRDFGILAVRHNSYIFEVAQFRADGNYSDGRRPDSVEIVQDFKQDASRRDFTINAMAMDSKGTLLDYFRGGQDLENKIIRTVGDPTKRFQEDHLRMIRAARFGSVEGFQIEENTKNAIQKSYELINLVSSERIRAELIKAASKSGPQFARFILILDELKLLGQILPEVADMKNFVHNMEYHPEGPLVFDHVIACLNLMMEGNPIYKIATLLHDIGKCVTLGVSKRGTPSYHGHEQESAKMAALVCKRLKFSLHHTDGIVFAARHHMKLHHLSEIKPSKIARLISSGHFDILAEVARVDEFSRGEKFKHRSKFEEEMKRVHEIAAKWESRVVNKSINLVSGKTIMAIVGIKPGPMVGKIKRIVGEHIIDRDIDPEDSERVKKLILEAMDGVI